MMRRRPRSRHVLVIAEEIDLLGGRNMENMDARAGFAGDAYETLGTLQRRDLVAPNRV